MVGVPPYEYKSRLHLLSSRSARHDADQCQHSRLRPHIGVCCPLGVSSVGSNAGITLCMQGQNFQTFKEPKNRFQKIYSARLCGLAVLNDNPIPTRFLAPIDCLKIPAQVAFVGLIRHIPSLALDAYL